MSWADKRMSVLIRTLPFARAYLTMFEVPVRKRASRIIGKPV